MSLLCSEQTTTDNVCVCVCVRMQIHKEGTFFIALPGWENDVVGDGENKSAEGLYCF